MKTTTQKIEPDTRTPEEKEFDDLVIAAVESGNWQGFETTELLTEEGAKQIIEFARNLDPRTLLDQITRQPFRWKQHVFRIVRCEYDSGKAQVEVEPHDPEFVAEVKKRIEGNRFHYLPYYQAFGFISFPEDFEHYKD